ncbi:L-glutamate gamma-semialdehyde dehydrogenase [Alteribacillus iranensis]|uniref:L-glutamate gamma-semialdehyde dehydrogenase n=1 Tax=Alteribacillus iranensis TaxID=930128 RepID=A0A1I2DIU8_9BACI|nr:L-glutamate gamma-semialdehyde dehydrogenase [Alteribacillus iranensis]SFE80464.1 delta-1-pyrroline-5-carboxylate dehydrogenase [Alteribacillus iranensis]
MAVLTFRNEPQINWREKENKDRIRHALNNVKEQFSREYPLYVGTQEIFTDKKLPSYNPSDHEEIIGFVSQANTERVEEAILAARKSFLTWQLKSFEERASYLFKAAEVMRSQKFELMAWQIYEAGKNWTEAEGELNEAIDFLEMYGRKAIEIGEGKDLIRLPGIDNRLEYTPLGVGAIIPPWNFPLAIVVGMTVSAIVTGNTVLLKPASLTPVIAVKFMEIMKAVDLPEGVINFVPGPSREIGDYMVAHKDVNFVSFTGSKDAGLHIDEVAHTRIPGQKWIKRVVAEMGGKNGVVVDKSADLSSAAEGIVSSAFGYQGQKCSAGSRAIVHESIYEQLIDEVVERARSLRIGPGYENNEVGPVIDEKAFEKITEYIQIGKEEATLVFGGKSDKEAGYFIEPTIFKDVNSNSRIMKEEIFGPVLAICKVTDIKEGIEIYNNTEFGLTGAIYTNKRDQIEYARKHMDCGNLFINGKCTGAMVGVQPFGGYYMSGTGSKTGCLEYLLNFVKAKTVSENL